WRPRHGTQSVPACVPTRSVGTRSEERGREKKRATAPAVAVLTWRERGNDPGRDKGEATMTATVLCCGLLSALLAGVADFFAALVSGRLGSFLTLLYMIAGSAALLLAAGLVRGSGPLGARDTAVLFLVAGAALVGYLAFYRALALGPVAVVSPIAACD